MGILSSLRASLLSLAAFACASALSGADRPGLSEQELKAAALNQVIHFARWPTGAFNAADSPLVIGIYGADPFGSLIDELTRDEFAGGHPVKVTRCFTPEAAAACHVVYLADGSDRAADRLLHALEKRAVLTVSGDEEFAERGGIVSLAVKGNRIRVLVNLEAAREANVTLSSKLLRLAEIVKK